MALFWNQNISCWSLDRRAKRIREKRRKKRREGEEEEEKRRRREIQERSKVWITMGLYGFLWLGMTISCYKPRV